ncbi:hypothetical protein U27_01543 [Candidatus Vecturithrix granuli]|uniref:Uncharacterized protein n=1 Tax=Vecturithrix granuli TaxID=1499967 RepID=A0A081CAN7_VECG1|nr:hypothetical protein U27_01543 [Candidatus Vecturithrix granuli]
MWSSVRTSLKVVSNPSRDYSAFLHATSANIVYALPYCFKPFQGLFRVSTLLDVRRPFTEKSCFKPFQGLFRVSTLTTCHSSSITQPVSNPSRDYSAFLRIRCGRGQNKDVSFQTLPGIIPRFYAFSAGQLCQPRTAFQTLPGIIPRFYEWNTWWHKQDTAGFKPFQGLFRVSTTTGGYRPVLAEVRFKPFQGLFRVSTIDRHTT